MTNKFEYAARVEQLSVRGHGTPNAPRNNRVQEESWFHCCSILQRFVKYRSQSSASVFAFCESRSQARIAASIEQSTDSSVAFSMRSRPNLRPLSCAFVIDNMASL